MRIEAILCMGHARFVKLYVIDDSLCYYHDYSVILFAISSSLDGWQLKQTVIH